MKENRDNLFIDIKSANSVRSLDELVEEAYVDSPITICQYSVGTHIKMWRKAQKGDNVIYAIDSLGVAGGEMTYLLKKCFRPRYINDHDDYKDTIHFIQGMNPKKYNKQWGEYMIKLHWNAIQQKLWLFLVAGMFVPAYRLVGNRNILSEKARRMYEAENELEKEAAKWALGDYCE